ncbi:MAG: endolytic transglycosylase MltG [Acidimicrobiia bacterium]|nr:endolytic transglycosylase MltG [Acidimicrobiia bacterium]
MRFNPRALLAAGIVTASAVTIVLVALGVGASGTGADDETSALPPAESSPAPVTTSDTVATTATEAPPTTSPPASSPPVPPSTTAPSTTTTAPRVTTTVPVEVVTPAGYTYVPKPSGGPGVIAPGGALTKTLAADIATTFGFDAVDVEAAIAAAELPVEAEGNPEGWLAPGSYPTDGATVAELIQSMVERRVSQLEERDVPRDQWQRVLTAASVIETETYNQNEKPRVARVLSNRLAGGGPLQMDSIILYPVAEDRIFTTSEERASNSPYNSYRRNGLPPTPISAPDEVSLDAFLSPPPGDWWFYVTVDLDTGETLFAVTYEGHQANVERLRAWLRENPEP